MASIFSRIVRGELPAAKVYEDEHALAFMDINPASRGHILVICKAEYADFFAIPPDVLAHVWRAAQRVAVALQATVEPDGLNVVQNNGFAAGQTVFHYHIHLIPRWEGDRALGLWHPRPGNQGELQVLAERIRQAMDG